MWPPDLHPCVDAACRSPRGLRATRRRRDEGGFAAPPPRILAALATVRARVSAWALFLLSGGLERPDVRWICAPQRRGHVAERGSLRVIGLGRLLLFGRGPGDLCDAEGPARLLPPAPFLATSALLAPRRLLKLVFRDSARRGFVCVAPRSPAALWSASVCGGVSRQRAERTPSRGRVAGFEGEMGRRRGRVPRWVGAPGLRNGVKQGGGGEGGEVRGASSRLPRPPVPRSSAARSVVARWHGGNVCCGGRFAPCQFASLRLLVPQVSTWMLPTLRCAAYRDVSRVVPTRCDKGSGGEWRGGREGEVAGLEVGGGRNARRTLSGRTGTDRVGPGRIGPGRPDRDRDPARPPVLSRLPLRPGPWVA